MPDSFVVITPQQAAQLTRPPLAPPVNQTPAIPGVTYTEPVPYSYETHPANKPHPPSSGESTATPQTNPTEPSGQPSGPTQAQEQVAPPKQPVPLPDNSGVLIGKNVGAYSPSGGYEMGITASGEIVGRSFNPNFQYANPSDVSKAKEKVLEAQSNPPGQAKNLEQILLEAGSVPKKNILTPTQGAPKIQAADKFYTQQEAPQKPEAPSDLLGFGKEAATGVYEFATIDAPNFVVTAARLSPPGFAAEFAYKTFIKGESDITAVPKRHAELAASLVTSIPTAALTVFTPGQPRQSARAAAGFLLPEIIEGAAGLKATIEPKISRVVVSETGLGGIIRQPSANPISKFITSKTGYGGIIQESAKPSASSGFTYQGPRLPPGSRTSLNEIYQNVRTLEPPTTRLQVQTQAARTAVQPLVQPQAKYAVEIVQLPGGRFSYKAVSLKQPEGTKTGSTSSSLIATKSGQLMIQRLKPKVESTFQTKVQPLTAVRTKTTQRQQTIQNPLTATRTAQQERQAQIERLATRQAVVAKTQQKTTTIFSSILQPASATKEVTIPKTAAKSASVQLFASNTSAKTIQATSTLLKRLDLTGQTPSVFKDESKLFKSKRRVRGFLTLIRRYGVFQPISNRPLPLSQALSLGVERTKASLAATFRAKATAKFVEAPDFTKDLRGTLAKEYTRPAPTSKLNAPLTFIQKVGTRLGTRAERLEIKLAKRRKRK